jgi:hypothetical protein
MKKKFVSFLLFTMLIFSASGAWAIGIGVYGTGGLAKDFITLSYMTNVDLKTHDYYGGAGIILDTAVAKDELFGYRLRLEYNQFNVKELKTGVELKGYNYIGMYHTFDFGIIRTELIRFWIGPQIGLSYTFGERRIPFTDAFGLSFVSVTYPLKLRAVGFDALLATGVNFNLEKMMTIFIDLGAGYMGKYNTNEKITGHAIGFKGSAGVMYRIDDNFKKM